MMNGHTDLIRSLSDDELARLERLLTTADKAQRIDLDAIVAAMREQPHPLPSPPYLPPDPGPAPRTAREASGGRRYELTLLNPRDIGNNPGLIGDEMEKRYAAEVARVEAMAAGGLSYTEAWDRIRRDCRKAALADLGDLDTDFDDEEEDPPRWRAKPNDGDAS